MRNMTEEELQDYLKMTDEEFEAWQNGEDEDEEFGSEPGWD